MAEEGQASTAQSNLLDSLPHLAWTQPFRLQGKQQLGVGGPTLLFTIPLKQTHSPSSQHDPVVHCNLIKVNTN